MLFNSNLRHRQPSDDYSVDPESIKFDTNDTVTANLKSKTGNPDLVLTLSGLENSTFRLKIKEIESKRYELADVLDGEPQTKKYLYKNSCIYSNIFFFFYSFGSIGRGNKSLAVTTNSESNRVEIFYSPFNIDFSKDGIPVAVFNGNRLTLSQVGSLTLNTKKIKPIIIYPI